MIYIYVLLFGALAVLVVAAYILGAALIGFALSYFIDILSYKIVKKVRKKEE